MMSGMRNAPPISISSPRETIASRPWASVLSTEQHRGGIVVDDGRVLGAGQLAEQVAHKVVALAAAAAVEIEFERDRVAHRGDCSLDRRLREQRAAEIGVQHGAGEVEDRLEARRGIGLKARNRCGGCLLSPYRLDAVCPRRRQRIADRADHGRAAETIDGKKRDLGSQHRVDRREQPAPIGGVAEGHHAPQSPTRNGLTPARQ